MNDKFKIRETTIHSVVHSQANKRATRPAFRCNETILTYGDVAESSIKFGNWLEQQGVRPRDRIALWLPNSPSWVIAQVAIAARGAICVPVNTRLTKSEVRHILQDSGCKGIVAVTEFLGREYVAEAEELAAEFQSMSAPWVLPVDLGREELPAPESGAKSPPVHAGDPAVLQYTSGTTGKPKGCLVSHRAWTNNARLTAQPWLLSPDDVVYSPCPLFFLFGSLTAMMGSFSAGAEFATTQTYDVRKTIADIQAISATWFIGVPTMWTDVLRHARRGQLTTLRGGTWGGGPFPRRPLEEALNDTNLQLDITAIYGMTEAPSITVLRADDPIPKKAATVGRPGPGIEILAVDEKGNEVPPDTTGELLTRGYNTMLEYWGLPEETAARYRGDWIVTGDLGVIDADGYVRIEGRTTDMILVGGSNVYAREVEDAILSIKGVKRVGVVGQKDSRLGEVPIAFVELEDLSLTSHEIRSRCAEQIAQYKVPREIKIVPGIPLTATGKIHKARLQDLANN